MVTNNNTLKQGWWYDDSL